MKRLFALAASALLVASVSHAGKFNPDAMAKMQQEGKKMAEQATLKPYRLPAGSCLTRNAGANSLSVQNCNGAPAQNWRFDQAGRFINQTGGCLRGAGPNVTVAACGDGPGFKWVRSAKAGLKSVAGGCVTAVAGGQVGLRPCAAGPNQQWQ